jgi:hypothetical protein
VELVKVLGVRRGGWVGGEFSMTDSVGPWPLFFQVEFALSFTELLTFGWKYQEFAKTDNNRACWQKCILASARIEWVAATFTNCE